MRTFITAGVILSAFVIIGTFAEGPIRCYSCTSYMDQCKDEVDDRSRDVSVKSCNSKCYLRIGEDGATYRGCFEGFQNVPGLKSDYIGCQKQTWNGKSLPWCLCDSEFCNGVSRSGLMALNNDSSSEEAMAYSAELGSESAEVRSQELNDSPEETTPPTTTTTTTTAPVPDIFCEESGFYQHPTDCTSFIACVRNGEYTPIRYLMTCPSSLQWDNNEQVCTENSPTCGGTGTGNGNGNVETRSFKKHPKDVTDAPSTTPPTTTYYTEPTSTPAPPEEGRYYNEDDVMDMAYYPSESEIEGGFLNDNEVIDNPYQYPDNDEENSWNYDDEYPYPQYK